MSFRHVALFRWQPGVAAEQVAEITRSLRALAETLEGCESYTCGPDLGLRENSFDYGVAAAFGSEDAWQAYIEHPEHVRIAEQLIAPNVSERASVQLEG